MNNVKYEVRDDILIINVDLRETHGPSNSGKTDLVASTHGNLKLPTHPHIRFGLNVFRKK
jgi:hypothetical protein